VPTRLARAQKLAERLNRGNRRATGAPLPAPTEAPAEPRCTVCGGHLLRGVLHPARAPPQPHHA
jgi:hypothetical protein